MPDTEPETNHLPPTVVLHMLPDFAIGGGQILLLRNLIHMPRARWRHIVCGLRGGPLVADFQNAGFETLDLGISSLADWPRAIMRLGTFLQRENVRIVHTNNTPGDRWMGQLAAMALRLPVVNSFHAQASPPVWPKGNWRLLPRYLCRQLVYLGNRLLVRTNIVRMVAVSNYVRDSYSKALWLRPERMAVIHPGLEFAAFQPPRSDESRLALRHSLGLGDASPILLCVGRLEHSKGQQYWLPVMADIRRDWPNACLVLVGEGPDRADIEATIKRFRLQESVKLIGWRDDVPALLGITDVFVSASLSEGFGLAVLEAMAAGKPVIAYYLPAQTEFVQDGVTGILVPSLEKEALGGALRKVLSEPGLMQQMGAAGREAARKFDANRAAARLEEIYQEVLALRGR